MMARARTDPSYKTLTRIIQIVKAVYTEKIDSQKKKGKGKKDEDEDMEEAEEETK